MYLFGINFNLFCGVFVICYSLIFCSREFSKEFYIIEDYKFLWNDIV